MNPELQRNIWLELTTRRMIAMPIILALIFTLPFGNVTLATFLYLGLTLFWGTRQAAEAVASEVAQRTWDWQRLSTLSAWQITWGKLIGATLYTWYGGIICLVILFAHASETAGIDDVLRNALHLVMASLMGQAVAFLTGLQTVRLRGRRSAAGSVLSQVIGILVGLWALQFSVFSDVGTHFAEVVDATLVDWYGLGISGTLFATLSLLVFLGWTLLGAHRLMLRELQYRTRPWAWPAFVLFCCVYGAGYVSAGSGLGRDFEEYILTGRLVVAFAIAAVLTYVALFWEDKDPVVFRRLIRAVRSGDSRTLLSHMPSWMVSLAVTAVLALLLIAFAEVPEIADITIWGALVAALLFMARDIGINLYLWLSPNRRRGNLSTLIILGLLYWVLPISLAFGNDGYLFLFYPWAPVEPLTAILAAGVQAALMAVLLAGRWRQQFSLQSA